MQSIARKISQNNFEIIELQNKYCKANIAVNIGNTLIHLSKRSADNALYFPYSLEEYKTNTKLAGNPFMHPWANRLEGDFITFNNEKFSLKDEFNQLYRDANRLPLHGLLLKSDKWKTTELVANVDHAFHVAMYDFDAEFFNLFPFKHQIFMKHLLQENTLLIETTIVNNDEKPMPISFGFHPYFSKTIEPTVLEIPSDTVIEVDKQMIPTGKSLNKNEKWNFEDDSITIKEETFDDGFKNLKYKNNQATFSINTIDVVFDEQYSYAQIYAPNKIEKPYVCIEPMTAPTNALNTNNCKMINRNETFTARFSIILS